MAFTANIKAPRQFNNNNNANNYQNTFDRLVTITDYDTAKGYMYATDEKRKNYEIFVNPEENRRAEAASKAKAHFATNVNNWMGHSIDENMKKALPPGSKVILIRSRVIKNDKTRDITQTEVHRIGGVPVPESDKTFQGIFTMTYRPDEGRERISRVQHWNPTAIDINNEDGLNNLKEIIDNARVNVGKKIGEWSITEPTTGVQFRALMKTDREYAYETDPAKKAIYQVVDMSLPFDWIPGPEDENGKEIKTEAHVLTGDEMMEFASMYVEYISTHEEFKDHLDNMKVEVCAYHVYPASKNDPLSLTTGDADKDKNADKNPLYQLSHRKSFIDLAQTESIMGRNAAVNGIIQLSGNKLQKVDGKPVEIPTNWVSKIHANNVRGHVHAFIRTEDGHKAEPHENLSLIKDEKKVSNATPAETQYKNQAPVETTNNFVAPTAAKVDTIEKEFDPFADDTGSIGDPFATEPATPAQTVSPVSATPAKSPLRFGAKTV